MSCRVCNSEPFSYKCPSCRLPYCSIPCWKEHKKTPCKNEDVPHNGSGEEQAPVPTYDYPTDDTVPRERLSMLEESEHLKNLLYNPHLRAMIAELCKSVDRNKTLTRFMQEPIFVEFADECMNVVDPPSQEELHEALLTNGIQD